MMFSRFNLFPALFFLKSNTFKLNMFKLQFKRKHFAVAKKKHKIFQHEKFNPLGQSWSFKHLINIHYLKCIDICLPLYLKRNYSFYSKKGAVRACHQKWVALTTMIMHRFVIVVNCEKYHWFQCNPFWMTQNVHVVVVQCQRSLILMIFSDPVFPFNFPFPVDRIQHLTFLSNPDNTKTFSQTKLRDSLYKPDSFQSATLPQMAKIRNIKVHSLYHSRRVHMI